MDLFTLYFLLSSSGGEDLGNSISYDVLNWIFGTTFTKETSKEDIKKKLREISNSLKNYEKEHQNILDIYYTFYTGGNR